MIHSSLQIIGSLILPFLFNLNLELQIDNIKDLEGTLYVAIYKSEEDFPLDGEWEFRTSQKVNSESELFKISGLEFDEFAIAIFHDVNDNGEMDKNWLGIPKEPFGFSNNVRPKFSSPEFQDCRIKIDEQNQHVKIDLIHKIFFK